MKFQISRETPPGSGNFLPVEVFEGDSTTAVERVRVLQTKRDGAYLSIPYSAPAEPGQAPSDDTSASH